MEKLIPQSGLECFFKIEPPELEHSPTSQTEVNYSTRPFSFSLNESYCIFCSIRLYRPPMNDTQVEEIKRHFGVVAEPFVATSAKLQKAIQGFAVNYGN